VGGAYPCAHQDPEHTNLLKGSIMHQGDLISPVDEQWDGICKQPPAQQPGKPANIQRIRTLVSALSKELESSSDRVRQHRTVQNVVIR